MKKQFSPMMLSFNNKLLPVGDKSSSGFSLKVRISKAHYEHTWDFAIPSARMKQLSPNVFLVKIRKPLVTFIFSILLAKLFRDSSLRSPKI